MDAALEMPVTFQGTQNKMFFTWYMWALDCEFH